MTEQTDQASQPNPKEMRDTADHGAAARVFLGDPLWEQAYRATKTEYLNAMLSIEAGPGGAPEREAIHAEMAALDNVYRTLRGWVTRGVDAENALAALEGHMGPPKDVPSLVGPNGAALRVN